MVVSKPEGRSERSSAGNMGFIYPKKKNQIRLVYKYLTCCWLWPYSSKGKSLVFFPWRLTFAEVTLIILLVTGSARRA